MNWLIYPKTKQIVATCAKVGQISCIICLIASISSAALLRIILSGSSLMIQRSFLISHELGLIAATLLSASLGLLLPWCHIVLLARRGAKMSLYASLLVLPIVALNLLTIVNFELRGLLSSSVLSIIFLCSIINQGKMAAAPLRMRIAIFALPILLILYFAFAEAGAILISLPLAIAIAVCGYPLLRQLSKNAPYIAGLPPTH